jgi:hypothetical protein
LNISIGPRINQGALSLPHSGTWKTLVSESTANDTFNYWLPLLRELLPSSLIEQVKKNASDYEIVKEILTEYELTVDTYEQVRERPGDNEEQEEYYSGKKSNHTFKSQMII